MLAATDPRPWNDAAAGWPAEWGIAGFAFAATPANATPPAVATVRAAVRATCCHFLMGISFSSGPGTGPSVLLLAVTAVAELIGK
jgi:hypothetical protein